MPLANAMTNSAIFSIAQQTILIHANQEHKTIESIVEAVRQAPREILLTKTIDGLGHLDRQIAKPRLASNERRDLTSYGIIMLYIGIPCLMREDDGRPVSAHLTDAMGRRREDICECIMQAGIRSDRENIEAAQRQVKSLIETLRKCPSPEAFIRESWEAAECLIAAAAIFLVMANIERE